MRSVWSSEYSVNEMYVHCQNSKTYLGAFGCDSRTRSNSSGGEHTFVEVEERLRNARRRPSKKQCHMTPSGTSDELICFSRFESSQAIRVLPQVYSYRIEFKNCLTLLSLCIDGKYPMNCKIIHYVYCQIIKITVHINH